MREALRNVDVIVVGAGQAGCAAALDLAVAGRRVLLLDKPQHKPCAGGVTVKALKLLRFPIDDLVRERPLQLDLSLNGRRRLQWPLAQPMCVLVERGELDARSLKQARLAGVEYRSIHAIEHVRQTMTGVTLGVDGETLTADYLIAADGAHSPLRRLLIGGEKAGGTYAIEARVARNMARHYPGMTLDFAATTHGYGWLFPKGDHINVGLYASRMSGALPNRAALQGYARHALGVAATDLTDIRGYPLGTRMGRLHLAAGRVLFAGDAAGSCEPLLGEGIYGAILTGQLAAASILKEKSLKAKGLETRGMEARNLKASDRAAPAVAARPNAASLVVKNTASNSASADKAGTVYTNACAAWRREVIYLGHIRQLFYAALPLAYGGLHHGARRRLTLGYAAGLTPLQSLLQQAPRNPRPDVF